MSNKIPFNKKLYDTGKVASSGKIEQHWEQEVIKNVFGKKREKKELENLRFKFYDPDFLLKTFNIGGFEFGNWLSQEDRYIYMAGCAYAMKDFCDLHKIPYSKFGFNDLKIAFGARGSGSARAHFEPSRNVINITRHSDDTNIFGDKKAILFSGAGSFGHEYGHAIDFFIGRNIKNFEYNFATESIKYITYSHTENKEKFFTLKKEVSDIKIKPFFDVMLSLIYTKKGDYFIHSDFYKFLIRKLDKTKGMGDYWSSDIEIFARSFEVYLKMKCDSKNIEESFLKRTKYSAFVYPGLDFMKKSGAYKNFEKLIKAVFKSNK